MSKEDFVLDAQIRTDEGKGASRRLRHSNLTPAIIYGGKEAPQSITLEHKELAKHLENEAFYSHIVSLNVAGKAQDVILKDLQRHPAKPIVMHADFLRVSQTEKFTTKVPLHFINEDIAPGVKTNGGIVNHIMTDLEISCLPRDLPEFIEVDLAEIDLGDIVHISDLKLPEGVESIALNHGSDYDLSVASIVKPRGVAEEEESSDTEAEGEEGGDAE